MTARDTGRYSLSTCLLNESWKDQHLATAGPVAPNVQLENPNTCRKSHQSSSPSAQRTVLLLLDLQKDLLDSSELDLDERGCLVDRLATLANDVLREGGVVCWISSHYATTCKVGTEGAKLCPDIARMRDALENVCKILRIADPKANPAILSTSKHWYSAFLETTLHAFLQQWGVQNLLVAGMAQSVTATVCSAKSLGYRVVVPLDAIVLDTQTEKEVLEKLQGRGVGFLQPGMQALRVFRSMNLSEDVNQVAPCKEVIRSGHGHLLFDGDKRLSGLGAGDSTLRPSILPGGELHALMAELFSAGRDTYEKMWNSDSQTSTCSAQLGRLRLRVEEATGHSINWVQVRVHRSHDKVVNTNCSQLLSSHCRSIVVVGCQGKLELRPKSGHDGSPIQNVKVQHNTLLVLGRETLNAFDYALASHSMKSSGNWSTAITLTFGQSDKRCETRVATETLSSLRLIVNARGAETSPSTPSRRGPGARSNKKIVRPMRSPQSVVTDSLLLVADNVSQETEPGTDLSQKRKNLLPPPPPPLHRKPARAPHCNEAEDQYQDASMSVPEDTTNVGAWATISSKSRKSKPMFPQASSACEFVLEHLTTSSGVCLFLFAFLTQANLLEHPFRCVLVAIILGLMQRKKGVVRKAMRQLKRFENELRALLFDPS